MLIRNRDSPLRPCCISINDKYKGGYANVRDTGT